MVCQAANMSRLFPRYNTPLPPFPGKIFLSKADFLDDAKNFADPVAPISHQSGPPGFALPDLNLKWGQISTITPNINHCTRYHHHVTTSWVCAIVHCCGLNLFLTFHSTPPSISYFSLGPKLHLILFTFLSPEAYMWLLHLLSVANLFTWPQTF